MPQANAVRAALKKLDLFVISDNVLSNDTIEAGAQVLLPAAAWGEKDGTVTNSERRISRQRAFLPLPGETRPDWWIVSEVARQLDFGHAFNYSGPAEIFREHAALSAFENNGERDFDIGALASLSDEAYDALSPVMWPARLGARRRARRFFAAGRFFTSDRRARFVAPEQPQPHATTTDIFPLRLNTGRLRDHWHTMTRTGASPRLCAHSPEPRIEIHPADAAAAKLIDGGYAKITARQGTAILKVSLQTTQQRGSIFAPIHWSSTTSSHASIGDLITAATDPHSGQPESKTTPVRLEPVEFASRGFVLTRHPVALPNGTWFARVSVAGGFGAFFATDEPPAVWCDLARELLPANSEFAEYIDHARNVIRIAAYRSGRLDGALCLGPAHAPPRWEMLRSLFALGTVSEDERRMLLSGCDDDAVVEAGSTICTCFNVSLSAISKAITHGDAMSVAALGRALRVGTNCGSCVPELRGIIERVSKRSR
jgi:assimilatory nitrate reductase catalytic subunit